MWTGKIFVKTKEALEEGKYYPVKITMAYSYDCMGRTDKMKWNAPNILTIIRMILIPFFVLFYFHGIT